MREQIARLLCELDGLDWHGTKIRANHDYFYARADAILPLMEKVAQAAIDASAGPLDDCGAEIETALTTEGIYVWGPDGERFERMFEAVMTKRRALSPKAIVEGVK